MHNLKNNSKVNRKMDKRIEFEKKSFEEEALDGLDEGSFIYHAMNTLLRRLDNKKNPEIDFLKTLESTEIIESFYKKQAGKILSERWRTSEKDDNFKRIAEIAYIESKRYVDFSGKSQHLNINNEQTLLNCFDSIKIPEDLFGFSKEFYISLVFSIVLFMISSRRSKKDKEEILKAINECK